MTSFILFPAKSNTQRSPGSIRPQARHPIRDGVAAAHIGLYQPVDHEGRRHMDAVLAGISAVPLHLAVQIGDGEGLGELDAAIALDPMDDVVGCRLEVRPAAMALELEFL